ncbi:MAG: polysaccharide deacetylase family protein [SAR324 cluster bacterium]|nr:polysaccharide deacetylase family protein [SAR324 cluster bacterium]MCZ6629327.1 polysaccharide deacetylase family protein [SAR324 cluster bacterium]MCZ6646768.1 polysaccharide deacetylase family protein [SAR324 cluster bacterium]MCZ6728426.1 polysaccharide deacetylase family protein [SAR324 cluster bacterium]
MLPAHNRYPFSAITDRPDYSWPDGKRLAFYIALNVEHFAFGESPGSDFTSVSLPPYHRGYAWRDYGNRVGIWRLLDLFEELQLPVALLVNGSVYDHCPQVLEPYRARGDEIVGHGRTNSQRQGDLPEEEERALIAEATDILTRHEGKPPAGWLGPWISQSMVTPDLLKEAGYSYMLDWHFDDQPIWFSTRAGPLLAVPYPCMEINDSTAIIYRRASDADFTTIIMDNLDEQLEQSVKQPMVFALSLHTFIVGQPFRLRQLRRALRHVADHAKDIWLTRPGEIASYVAGLPPGTVPGG